MCGCMFANQCTVSFDVGSPHGLQQYAPTTAPLSLPGRTDMAKERFGARSSNNVTERIAQEPALEKIKRG